MARSSKPLILFTVLAALPLAQAGAQPFAISLDPKGVGEVGPPVIDGANDCAGGEIYDDGTAENGYSGNPALISQFDGVQQFTPAAYPGGYDSVCVGLVSLAGPTLDFSIVAWDDDGPGGQPGTELGTVPASAATIPAGLPCGWFQFDITSLGLSIASGNVWLGVRWNPMLFPSRFVCSDETPATPLHPGFVNFNNPNMWQATQTVFPAYRAKLIRALASQDADLSLSKTGVLVGTTATYTIQVDNNGPGNATNVVVTDPLPACGVYVSDDCGGANVPPWTWTVGNLANGASATCNVVVDLSACSGAVANTASVNADQNDPAPGDESSTFTFAIAQSAVEIPTLSTVGVAALLLFLAGGAMLLLRRRADAK